MSKQGKIKNGNNKAKHTKLLNQKKNKIREEKLLNKQVNLNLTSSVFLGTEFSRAEISANVVKLKKSCKSLDFDFVDVKFINLALLAIPVCITASLFAILIRIISFMRKSIDKLQHDFTTIFPTPRSIFSDLWTILLGWISDLWTILLGFLNPPPAQMSSHGS